MIVRIDMTDNDMLFTMLFGNSYEDWLTQFKEYLCTNISWSGGTPNTLEKCYITSIKGVEVSKSKWPGYGLKWCLYANFQDVLNREGCQDNEPNLENPRQYSDMIFYKDEKITSKIMDIFNKRLHK